MESSSKINFLTPPSLVQMGQEGIVEVIASALEVLKGQDRDFVISHLEKKQISIITCREQKRVYLIEKFLGSGLLATAFQARAVDLTGEKPRLMEAVAVKFVAFSDGCTTPRFFAEREVKFLQQVDSDFYLRVQESGTIPQDHQFLSVTELMDGELKTYLTRKEPLSLPHFFSIANQVAQAAQVLSRHNIFNPDLRSGNVLYKLRNGQITIKVGDLNMASTCEEQKAYGAGTHTAAPEVLFRYFANYCEFHKKEYPVPYSLGSEINAWGLGVVCYELFTKLAERQIKRLPTAESSEEIFKLTAKKPDSDFKDHYEKGLFVLADLVLSASRPASSIFVTALSTDGKIRGLINSLLQCDPKDRLSIEQAIQTFSEIENTTTLVSSSSQAVAQGSGAVSLDDVSTIYPSPTRKGATPSRQMTPPPRQLTPSSRTPQSRSPRKVTPLSPLSLNSPFRSPLSPSPSYLKRAAEEQISPEIRKKAQHDKN